jgi:hypothetical protein
MTKTIVAYRGDGFGTRLQTILHAQILARILNFNFEVVWTSYGPPELYAGAGQFSKPHLELFDKDFVFSNCPDNLRGNFVDLTQVSSPNFYDISNDFGELYALSKTDFLNLIQDRQGALFTNPGIPFGFMNAEIDVAREVKTLWSAIQWNAVIEHSVASFDNIGRMDEMIAVHVRRGDLLCLVRNSDISFLRNGGMNMIFARYVPLQDLFEEIDEIREKEKILVCSEEHDVVKAFEVRYGSANVCSSWEVASGGTEHQRAIIDLILLSRCKLLVAPFGSTFSGCAATVGTCKAHRVVADLHLQVEDLLEIVQTGCDQSPDRLNTVSAIICATAAGKLHNSDPAFRTELISRATKYGTVLVTQHNFQEALYLSSNPDVAAAVKAGLVHSGYDHFIVHGQLERRTMQVEPELISRATKYGTVLVTQHNFQEALYLSSNPDVAAAVKAGLIHSGYDHFIVHGQLERRTMQVEPLAS